MEDLIQHRGIIERIEKRKVFVRIEQKAACCACHARSACLASDKKEKVIEIDDVTSGIYAPHEQVVVSAHASTGLFAVMMSFAIPLILVVIALIAGLSRSGNEGVGGLAGLSILIPYYLILYIFRDKLKKKCVFTLTKVQNTATP
jgi:sigma-E factor negative regulatory protein RseC